MTSRFLEQYFIESKVNEYHLIFYLNGTSCNRRRSTRSQPVLLKPRLKEFFSTCATKFTLYIWFSTMRKNFSEHLEIIKERFGVHLNSSRIVDQMLCFKNDHSSPRSPRSLFCIKTQMHFCVFPGTNYENALLVDDMPYKSLCNPPSSAIFLQTFYRSQENGNYLFETIFPQKPCIPLECGFLNL